MNYQTCARVNEQRIPEATGTAEELGYVERAVAGDTRAFEWLYHRYSRKVYSLVYRIVGTANDAEEVTQEVFCQAYRGLARFEGRSRFYTWIFRIATNLSLQHVQKLARSKDKASLEDLTERNGPIAISTDDDPEKVVQDKEFLQKLEESLTRLSPNHRAVMTLGPILGHSYEDIGEILGVTPEVVKGRLHRARERVRELMKAYR